ncbi:MAG: Efflux ABC transporter, permease protein [uncultured Paraburkholderia sp.]|nr:MAG: Efflux ABC transporter, permease protein [uncultured Paraburkholderia sp.]CAH2807520.1 MAG: Efflux ABC transporter, permease protein [uncultured Paraburkholderia sp.]CAH2903616.1 MAG: Efflux ABC transporter, permease protein [uncultured Paraburkholderia sp.]CAH2941926.1 MAG: Efflux ABC transporter, permease protein [uncultured Paraburkholderia sp.]CAH2942793.1 MAG: Efflux ABC transporter, permease protein [uncultured Paraburkholderia sp.]
MDARTYRSNEATPGRQAPLAALPANAVNWIAVWRRNYLVWKSSRSPRCSAISPIR